MILKKYITVKHGCKEHAYCKLMFTKNWNIAEKSLFLALKGGRSIILPPLRAKKKNWWVSNNKIYTVKMYIHFKTYTGTMNHVSIYNADGDFFFQPQNSI